MGGHNDGHALWIGHGKVDVPAPFFEQYPLCRPAVGKKHQLLSQRRTHVGTTHAQWFPSRVCGRRIIYPCGHFDAGGPADGSDHYLDMGK